MEPIVTLTMNPTVDVLMEVDQLVAEGKSRSDVRNVAAGGGGINVARGFRELGGRAVAVHTSGGATGERLDRLLDGEQFEHVSVEIEGETREALVLTERKKSRSFHVVPRGPRVDEASVDRIVQAVLDRIGTHDFVVASGSLAPGCPDDFYGRLARAVDDAGGRLVLDTSGPALEAALEQGVYLVKPNKREAAAMLGGEVDGFDDACAVNEQLLSRGAAQVVATTVGEYGAVVSADGRHISVRTPPLPRPFQSDAGAGDSFLAGLTYGLCDGLDLAEAGRLAVTAASAACMTPGTEMFYRSDVEELRADTRTDEMT